MKSSPKNPEPSATPANISSNKLATNERGIPLPWFIGRRSLPLNWAQTRIYNPKSTPITTKVGKNKNQVTGFNYFGDLVGLCACCLVDRIFGLEVGGTMLWEGTIERGPDNPHYASIDLPDGSSWRFYWGTADQPLDDLVLSTCGEDHPRYLEQAYLVGKRVSFGSNTSDAPNIRVLAERSAKFAGLDEALVHEGANPVTAIAELIGNDWFGLGLPGLIHLDSWAALCPIVRRETPLPLPGAPGHVAALGYIAAFMDRQQSAQSILSQLLEYFDGWIRPRGTQLEIGHFPHDGVIPDDLPELTYHDFVTHPEFSSPDSDDGAQIKTDAIVVFNDRELTGEENTAAAPNTAARRKLGEYNPVTLRRPFICTSYQAQLIAAEVAKERGRPQGTAANAIRRSRIGALREGDRFILNDAPSGYRQVVRITQRTDPSSGSEVRVSLVEERGLAPLPFIAPPNATPYLPAPDLVTIVHARVFQLPRAFADTGPVPTITILAERPAVHIGGYRLHLSTDDATYDEILTEGRWALRGALVGAITGGAGTITVHADGPDLELLEARSAAEQLDDTLLVVCGFEILSIGDVTALGGNDYEIAVTRGRRGSAAAAHADGAECYIVARSELEVLQNANFPRATGTRYFKLATYTPKEEQELADALKLTFAFDDTEVVTPTGLGALAKAEMISLSWDFPDDATIAMVEIWERGSATPVPVDGDIWQHEILASGFPRTGLAAGTHRWFWIRFRDTINDKSAIVGPVDATALAAPTGPAGPAGGVGPGGATGPVGPGLVYMGDYDAGMIYFFTSVRQDVVSVGANYYPAANAAKSGLATWGTPGASADWGAAFTNFRAVATDLLLARDATILRTLVMGDGATPNAGLIRSAGASAFNAGAGFWLGHSGTTAQFRIGDPAGKYLAWDGATLEAVFGSSLLLDDNGITFGSTAGKHFKWFLSSGVASLSLYDGATNKGFWSFQSGVPTLDLGSASAARLQSVWQVASQQLRAFDSADPRTNDAPMTTFGGAWIEKTLDVRASAYVVGNLTAASLLTAAGQLRLNGGGRHELNSVSGRSISIAPQGTESWVFGTDGHLKSFSNACGLRLVTSDGYTIALNDGSNDLRLAWDSGRLMLKVSGTVVGGFTPVP
jgi:hypothetical protein